MSTLPPDSTAGTEPAPGPGASFPAEEQARVRRSYDLLEAAVSTLAAVLLVGAAHEAPVGAEELTGDVASAMGHLPRVFVFACAVVAALATIALVGAIATSLFRRRRRDGVNAVAAGLLAILVGSGLVVAWHAFPGGVASAVLHRTDGSTLVRDGAIVAVITGADVVRLPAFSRWCVPVATALVVTGLALGEITFLGSVVAVLVGVAAGCLARFALGTTVRRPSLASLTAGLRRAGVEVVDLERRADSAGELDGRLANGRALLLEVANQETGAAGLARRLWSFVRLSTAAIGRQPFSVRAALQTEALASFMAETAGIVAPRVLLLAHFEPDTLVLAREQLEGGGPDGSTTPEQAAALFAALRRLHEVGVAHRDLRPENLLCEPPSGDEPGRVGFRSLASAVVGAGELVRRVDLAQLVTSLAGAIGASGAVAALRSGYGEIDERALATILQPVALTSWGASRIRAAREPMAAVRTELVGTEPVEPGEVRLERFAYRRVVLVLAVLVAAFLVVGQLSSVDLGGALEKADWRWFAVAIAGSAVTYLASAMNLLAFVPGHISRWKGALVEVSGAFFGLVTPATVGHVAVNGRFLHRQGVDATTVASSLGISQVVNFLVTAVLLVVAVLITGSGFGHLGIVPGPKLLGVLGGVVVLGVLAITVVPVTKRLFFERLWPRFRTTLPQLVSLASEPLRLAEGIGGNLLLTASYSVALIASLHAVGADPPVIAAAAVFMAGNTLGAAAPTPGGLGAVESVMVAGLAAIGIPAHEAIPGVLLFRLATFWLPILPGWIAFLLLQRRHVL